MIIAMNKNILMKLNEKTKDDEMQRNFLLEIFKYEFTAKTKKGWYKGKYEELLEKSIGEEKDEN